MNEAVAYLMIAIAFILPIAALFASHQRYKDAEKRHMRFVENRDGLVDEEKNKIKKRYASESINMNQPNDFRIKRVAVVCHNYNIRNRYGLEDYTEHFSEINQICDNNGCDTILYALFTWDKNSGSDSF